MSPPPGPPPVVNTPPAVTVAASTSSTALVVIAPPRSGCLPLSYTLKCSATYWPDAPIAAALAPGVLNYTLTGLAPGRDYTATATGVCPGPTSTPPSAPVAFATAHAVLAYAPPSAPSCNNALQLLATGGSSNDLVGNAVALSDDGSTAVVGAFGVSNLAGAAYAFTKSGATWSTGALLATGGSANDNFGQAVAVSSDGSTAVVGLGFRV